MSNREAPSEPSPLRNPEACFNPADDPQSDVTIHTEDSERSEDDSDEDPTCGGFVVNSDEEEDVPICISENAEVCVANILPEGQRRRRKAPVRYEPEEQVVDDYTDDEDYDADDDVDDDEDEDVVEESDDDFKMEEEDDCVPEESDGFDSPEVNSDGEACTQDRLQIPPLPSTTEAMEDESEADTE